MRLLIFTLVVMLICTPTYCGGWSSEDVDDDGIIGMTDILKVVSKWGNRYDFPEFKILAPKGGETVTDYLEIKWVLRKNPNLNTLIDIHLKEIHSQNWIEIKIGLNNTGKFVWYPAPSIPSGNYQIILTAKNQYLDTSVYSEPFYYNGPAIPPEDPLNNWIYGANINSGRYGLGAVVYNEKIYITGGKFDNTISNSIECYNNGTWNNLTPMLYAQGGHAVALVGSKIYNFGNYKLGPEKSGNLIQIYNIETDTWEYNETLTPERYWATAQTVGSKIYLMGGYSLGRALNTLDIFDTETNQWSIGPPLLYPTYLGNSCLYNNQIFLIGGNINKSTTYSQKFDLATEQWLEIPKYDAEYLFGAKTVVYEDKIYLLGGYYIDSVYSAQSATYIFDPATEIWETGTELKTARYQFGAVTLNDSIYVIGGRDANAIALKTIEIMQLK